MKCTSKGIVHTVKCNISEYTYICTKWILKRNGKYRCGNFGDINWTITPLIDTKGNGLVLSSDGKNVVVKNDISASNQCWLLSKQSSSLSGVKVETTRKSKYNT